MWENFTKTQKIIGAVVALAFVGVIIFAVAMLVYRAGKVAVTVKYAPYSAVVTLDGRRIANNSTEYVVAGEYDLVVELEHFDKVEETVTVSEDYPYVIGVMKANTDMGRQIASERQSEYMEVEGISGGLAADAGAKEKEEYPILKYLPVNNALFSISYAYNDDKSLQVNVKATWTYWNSVMERLYGFSGVEPTDYNIVFKDIVNPFEGTFVKNDAANALDFLKNGYGGVMGEKYIVQDGRYEGNYYYTTIETAVGQQDGHFASWRVLLERSGGEWKFVAVPYPVLTKYNAPNVSTELLNKVNRLY